jgi:hypothetical protein
MGADGKRVDTVTKVLPAYAVNIKLLYPPDTVMIKTVFSKYLNWKHQKFYQSRGEKNGTGQRGINWERHKIIK